MWWLVIVGGALVAAVFLRRVFPRSHLSAEIDVGNVSENWLSEQRGRKD